MYSSETILWIGVIVLIYVSFYHWLLIQHTSLRRRIKFDTVIRTHFVCEEDGVEKPRLPFLSQVQWNSCFEDAFLQKVHKKWNRSASLNSTIYMELDGRLGNNMYQAIGIFIIAKTLNVNLVVSSKYRINQIFPYFPVKVLYNKTLNNLTSLKIVTPLLKVLLRKKGHIMTTEDLVNELIEKLPLGDVFVKHFLQSTSLYHRKCRLNITHSFTFNSAIRKKAEDFLHSIRKTSCDAFIGIHVRRGDQKVYYANRTFFTASYIKQAMVYFTQRTKKPIFVISSSKDIRSWISQHINETGVHLTSAENSAEEDMAILTLCNNSIVTVGTFGFWAGYLTKGLTIQYSENGHYDPKLHVNYLSNSAY